MHTSETERIETRQERGLKIAATVKLQQTSKGWIVPSETTEGIAYIVDPIAGTCTCSDFEAQGGCCKHQWAVAFTIERETKPNDTTILKATRMTYTQNWPAYDAAQTHESERFVELLSGLCAGIEQPVQSIGRPQLPLCDIVFALTLKTYSTVSGRRATGYIRNAEAQGFIDRAPHYSSAFRRLESQDLTPLLKRLIEESARPLQAVEVDFAIDSTGFSTNCYSRWFDHKWGRMRSEQRWIKLHLITGVKTNVITSVEATSTETADAPFLKPLVDATARTFPIREVSGDKAYSSRRNLRAVRAVGAMPYIPFKAGTTGLGQKFDLLWNKMWHYYHCNRDTFLAHYHKRSNVETTVSMVKGKFGASVRAKTPTAQVNEVLLKVLCHNICVLIASIYELGLEPTFWDAKPVRQEYEHQVPMF